MTGKLDDSQPRHGVTCRIRMETEDRNRRRMRVFYVEGITHAVDDAIEFMRDALGADEGSARKFRLDGADTDIGAFRGSWAEVEPWVEEMGQDGDWILFQFRPEVFEKHEKELKDFAGWARMGFKESWRPKGMTKMPPPKPAGRSFGIPL